ncbi:MAG: MG2 domain-containing protein [Acidobacteriota bacterium]
MKKTSIVFFLGLLSVALPAGAADALRVVKAGPVGEIATIAEANEVRVIFSEPMVVLGRIPDKVQVPFFRISPELPGTFRWSGTTTLIFTPDPKKKLPNATTYQVTISDSATAVSGSTLPRPYTFSFTTPTLKLLRTQWYRKDGQANAPVVLALRFNQRVDRAKLAAHIKLAYVSHDWTRAELPPAGRGWLEKNDPSAISAFNRKVAATDQVVQASGPVFVFLAEDWDKKQFPQSNDLVVLQTRPGLPADGWIRLTIDSGVPSLEGPATPDAPQEYVVKLSKTLFADGLECTSACDPESWNPIRFRVKVPVSEARKSITVIDVTDPAHPVTLTPQKAREKTVDVEEEGEDYDYDQQFAITLQDLGFTTLPARTYRISVAPDLKASDGQTLGYHWVGILEQWHKSAFTSFGDGHGVWEASGGPLLPFSARNTKNVSQWLASLRLDELMPTMLNEEKAGFRLTPSTKPVNRKLNPTPDKIQSYGMDITPVVATSGKGLVWAAVKDGEPIPHSHPAWDVSEPKATLVQVTDMGISVKDSPLNTLIFVTRLDNAAPVAGAHVSIRTRDNKVFWSGTTDANGLALAPNTDMRLRAEKEDREARAADHPDSMTEDEEPGWYDFYTLQFVVTAEKDGDTAYVASNWTEGVDPWSFNQNFSLWEAKPLLRGEIFADRGVYKPGEDVHLKAILRSDTPTGIQLLPPKTAVEILVRDAVGKDVDKRSITTNQWSSGEWLFHVPPDGSLGNYQITATVKGQRTALNGEFLVAAYRRPDFRVDLSLSGTDLIAGNKMAGTVSARYLFGAPMASRPVRWTYSKNPVFSPPAAVTEHFPDRYTFVGDDWSDDQSWPSGTISKKEGTLNAKGELPLSLPTEAAAGIPYDYKLEGEVTDVSRQRIANRISTRVHPAPWYVGVRTPPYFATTSLDTDVIAVTPEGLMAPGVGVTVALKKIQWNSVRRAEGNGFYTWESERKEVDAGKWDVTTAANPVPLHIDLKNGGYYVLTATATDKGGRYTRTVLPFYALGSGYTAWERFDHNRIDLVPEKKTYKPGESARIMIQSPWETATALLTTEREGVRTYKRFDLTSTQQTVTVPITIKDIPNVYVSVLLIKGRTKEAATEDSSDPGKPSFRLGYTELQVEDSAKRLNVTVTANKEEYRPATKATVEVEVKDQQSKPARSEVTLWAVDYGVLSLTNYRTPDVLGSIYVDKAIQVLNEDSRQRIISRRVLTPKGADAGGGGGKDLGAEAMRKDFRPLAFWLGSIETDKKGQASTTVTLPDSLTTYRIMAVAGDRDSRFGFADTEIRTNKPVLLSQAFPRFMALGDKAYFGSVIHSQIDRAGSAVVTMRSLDPSVIQIVGDGVQNADVTAKGTTEVRFQVEAKAVGKARIQTTVKLLGETDAFEDVIPVEVISSIETVAAYGELKESAKETLAIPTAVVPGIGGLHLELASTAMVGLAEGARYLVEYPYGCAEQRSSRGLALVLVSDLGEAFKLPGIDANKTKDAAQKNLRELEKFQCGNGGFALWPGDCAYTSPYLASYVLHVLQTGKSLGYVVTPDVLERGYTYLDQVLSEPQPENEGWWPAYTAWQSFAVKVLTEGGRNEDSNFNRLYGYLDRMPVFAISYLYDAAQARKETGKRTEELRRRIYNAIEPEGGSSHVEELSDPYLLWFWNSNVRSSAIVLRSLVNDGDPALVRGLVRWLMKVRKNGRWGNTQENALAMEALVAYYRKYESEVPDFTSIVTLGASEISSDTFKGRSTETKTTELPMKSLLERPAGERQDLLFRKTGSGTLFYMASLRYASLDLFQKPLESGFRVERRYSISSNPKGNATTFKAGDLVTVTLTIRNTKERRYVAVTDPLPAGFEPVESLFATTASDTNAAQQGDEETPDDWTSWWRRGGFDHVERHDDRVDLFATRLSEGTHIYTYAARATTAGTFRTAPTHAEEMYEPEVFGRAATEVVTVEP